MTDTPNRVSQLWDDLEINYGPSLTQDDLATLRALDDAEIDGTLTDVHFERTKRGLMNRLRSFSVDHATGQVDPAYWDAKNSEGRTNLQNRKSIHGKQNVTRKRRLHVVAIGSKENRVVREFPTAA